MGLSGPETMAWGSKNFLVRTRNLFAERGLMVLVPDAPSDLQSGMNAIFRMSADHATDISLLVDKIRRSVDVPVWLIGTSMGTFSAMNGAIDGKSINGLVLTSSITRAKPNWQIKDSHPNGIASMRTDAVKVPTLIIGHA